MARSRNKKSSIIRKRSRKGERLIEFARKFGLKLAILTFVLWLGAWMHLSGGFTRLGDWTEAKTVTAAAGFGFKIQNFMVEGRHFTDADTLRAIINVQKGDPLFSFDPAEAKSMIERISWVKTAEVQRRLPDTVYIRLEERMPVALWQKNQKVSVIDAEGKVLTSKNISAFRDLVIVTGEDSEFKAAELVDYLHGEPDIRYRTEAAALISGRRWNLKLRDGKIVKLPEDDIGYALSRLAKLNEEEQILERAVMAIDLRERDRISVQTAPNVIEKYKASYTKKDGAI